MHTSVFILHLTLQVLSGMLNQHRNDHLWTCVGVYIYMLTSHYLDIDTCEINTTNTVHDVNLTWIYTHPAHASRGSGGLQSII